MNFSVVLRRLLRSPPSPSGSGPLETRREYTSSASALEDKMAGSFSEVSCDVVSVDAAKAASASLTFSASLASSTSVWMTGRRKIRPEFVTYCKVVAQAGYKPLVRL